MSMKPIRIVGEIFYASDMVQFNQYTEEKQKYVAQIGNISEQDAAKLREVGVTVGKSDTKGLNITCKSLKKHNPVDQDGNPVNPLTIGNGSKCVALISTYEWTFGKKSGISPSLVKMIVTDLKEYVPAAATTADDDDIL